MTFPRRRFLHLVAGVTALSAAPRLASEDTFPTRPIKLVLPFPPGGAFDIIGRPWADKVSRTLGTVVVENKLKANMALIPKTANSAKLIQDMARRPLSRLGLSDLRQDPTVR